MSTKTIATIDTDALPAAQRVVLAKLLDGASKQLTKGLKGDDARCEPGSHPVALALRIEGEVVVDQPAETTEIELSLEEIVVVAVGPKKIVDWIEQHAKKVKAANKTKTKRDEIDVGVKALKKLVKDEAIRLRMTRPGSKAGATRCDPRVVVSEFSFAS